MMDMLGILKSTPQFADLDATELEAVAKCVVPRSFSAGDVLIEEGAPGECLFLVQSGRVKVEKAGADGPVLLSELGEGAAFGEMSLIETAPTSATVTALSDAEVLTIGRMDLNVLLSWNTILASKMWRAFTLTLSKRLREMNERLAAG
jgi:CRP/FNR family transcriptional regulator/CRP/FNR family cyclic AMP-dependent transcriptional regulator